MNLHKYCTIFPAMTGQDFDDLVADIRTNGLHNPIVTFGDEILDGRNRYAACQAAGIEDDYVHFREYLGTDPLGYVVSQNYRRRHLTQSQAAMVAAEIARLQQGRKATAETAPSEEEAAKTMRVSTSSVQAAKRVRKKDAALADKVKAGEVTLHAAEQQIKAAEKDGQVPLPTILVEALRLDMASHGEIPADQAACFAGHPLWTPIIPRIQTVGAAATMSGVRNMTVEEIVAWLKTPDGKEWFDAEWENAHPIPESFRKGLAECNKMIGATEALVTATKNAFLEVDGIKFTEVAEHPPMGEYRVAMMSQHPLTAAEVFDWISTEEGAKWRELDLKRIREDFYNNLTNAEADEWVAGTVAGEEWMAEQKSNIAASVKQPRAVTPSLVTAWIVTPEGQSWLKDYNARHGSLKKADKQEADLAAGRTVRIPTGPPFSLAHLTSAMATLTAMIPTDADHEKFADVMATFAAKELKLTRKSSDRFSPYTS